MAEVTNIDYNGEVLEIVDEKARESSKTANEKAEEANSIAKGRNQAHVFATTADMETFLSNPDNAGKYNKGDNIYIVELEVPDWWIAEVLTEADPDTGYYYKIGQLETQKVDLTNYLSTDDHVLVWRSNQIEGDDWAKAQFGVWNTKVTNDTYNIPGWSIIYKPSDDNFSGAFLVNYATGTQRGVYAWDNSASKFVKLVTNSFSNKNAVLYTDANGEVAASPDISTTELYYLDGVTSNIQTQLNGKVTNSFTASRVLISDSNGKAAASSSITTTELGYLDGVTSKIQTQLNKKMPISGGETTGQMQFIRNLGVTNVSYSQAGVSMIAPTNESASARAGIGFTNEGSNGVYLYLDTDGDFKFMSDQSVNKIISASEDVGLVTSSSTLNNYASSRNLKGVYQDSGGNQFFFLQIATSVYSVQILLLNDASTATRDKVAFRIATGSTFGSTKWSWLKTSSLT